MVRQSGRGSREILRLALWEFENRHTVTRYGKAGERHGREGSVMTVIFRLEGQAFTALNGGPLFTFSPAVSLVVHCDSQTEVDYFWDRLGEGGDPNAQQCGWLKDKFGLSWQIVPEAVLAMMAGGAPAKAERAMKALLQMRKLDLAALERAYQGG
jgi:predicted 3-demethylubiquinone-9 3-methyltransferase (glyoxalase superfamily)